MNLGRGFRPLTIFSSVVLLVAACSKHFVTTHEPREAAQRVATPSTNERLLAALQSRDFDSVRSIAGEMIALAREQEGPDSLTEAHGLSYLGGAAGGQHDFTTAERASNEALRICLDHYQSGRLSATEAPFCAVEVPQLLAMSLFSQGRFDESSEIRRVLLAYYEDMQGPERWRLLGELVRLATELVLAGHPDEANTHLSRAVVEWHQLRDRTLPIPQQLLQSFGESLIRFGDVAEAHDVLERAVQADEASGTPEDADKGRRLILLGRVLLERGDFGKAGERFARGVNVLEQTLGTVMGAGQDHPEAIVAWLYVGKTLLLLGDVTTARTVLQKVLLAAHALPESAKASINCFGCDAGELTVLLASAIAGTGNTDEARDLMRAMANGTKDDVWLDRPIAFFGADTARDLLALVRFLLSEREFQRAERYADLVKREVETRLGPEHPAFPRALFLGGLARGSQGNETEGLRLVRQSIDLADRIFDRQLAGLSGRQRLEALRFSDHVDVALSLPAGAMDAPTAYRVAVGRKNIIFRLAVEERPPRNSSPRVAALYRDYNAARLHLARLARAPVANEVPTRVAREALIDRAEVLERELNRSSDEFRRARGAARADFGAVCAALGPKTALVEYILFGNPRDKRLEYAAFVIRGDRCNGEPRRFSLGPAEPVSEAVQGLRVALKAGLRGIAPTPSVQQRAQQLADLVFPHELRTHLEGLPVLVIAPDHELATIPFTILAGDVGHDFLVETHSVFYVPSGRDLLRNERAFATGRGRPSVLAVGNPDFGVADAGLRGCEGLGFDALPGSENEVGEVVRRFRADGAVVTELIGERATKDAVIPGMRGKSVLHFATHAFVYRQICLASPNEGDPVEVRLAAPLVNAGLALRGANTRAAEGTLTALEIATLDLDQADLVVLSGCDTGLGIGVPGQELMGLRWAFMEAGARSVVASLWEVPDEATAQLMATFYDRLILDGFRPVAALREAQLARLQDDRAHGRSRPWEWGAFTISVSYPEAE